MEQLEEILVDYKQRQDPTYYDRNRIDAVATLYAIAVEGYPGVRSSGTSQIAIEAVASAISEPDDGELANAYLVVIIVHFGCEDAIII